MKTYLVSLISDHTLPNFLFIEEMREKYDELIFITTREMSEKGSANHLEKTLGFLKNSILRIEIPEDNLNGILECLETAHFSENDKYIINLTGGTKMMAIGSYTYFSKFLSSFYYIPIGKNKILNAKTSEESDLNYRIGLADYLSLYGLEIEYDSDPTYPPEHTKALFKKYKSSGFVRREIPEISDAQNHSESKDKRYYDGIWFEEYVYQRIKEEQQLEDDKIKTGIKLFREGSEQRNDNEIDIMFVKDNELYVGECKVSLIGKPGTDSNKLLEQYMYKLAAISKDFGIRVHPYIFTLHSSNRFSFARMESIEKRKKILGIKKIFFSNSFYQSTLDL